LSFPFLQSYLGLGSGLQTKNAAGGAGGGVGGWVELGRTTLGSTSDTITVSSLANKRYYMILSNLQASGQIRTGFRLGNGSADSGSNYSKRDEYNGGADATSTSQTVMNYFDNNNPIFAVSYLANFSSKEKLLTGHLIGQNVSGAGTPPVRQTFVGKYAYTSNAINVIQNYNTETGDYNSGSEVVVLGYDPADTHSNNFWTELSSTTLTGAAASIDTGTISAKKYLWVQLYANQSGYLNSSLNFNSDTGSNYAVRFSDDGGADSTSTSQTKLDLRMGEHANPSFSNTFIINSSSKEKLVISHNVNQKSSGSGTAPARGEVVGKWSNTSSQITSIQIVRTSGGSFASGSILKVWGSD